MGAALLALSSTVPASGAGEPPIVEVVPEVSIDAGFIPRQLPRREAAPITFLLGARFDLSQHWLPAPMQELGFELDRHIHLNLGAVPSCPYGIQDLPPPEEACGHSRVGGGKVQAVARFPEGSPEAVAGRIFIYRSGPRREPFLLLNMYFDAPIQGWVTPRLHFDRSGSGRLRLKAAAEVPRIAGSASITRISLWFKRGTFVARCADGKLQAQPFARLVDSSLFTTTVIRTCSVRR